MISNCWSSKSIQRQFDERPLAFKEVEKLSLKIFFFFKLTYFVKTSFRGFCFRFFFVDSLPKIEMQLTTTTNIDWGRERGWKLYKRKRSMKTRQRSFAEYFDSIFGIIFVAARFLFFGLCQFNVCQCKHMVFFFLKQSNQPMLITNEDDRNTSTATFNHTKSRQSAFRVYIFEHSIASFSALFLF